MVVVRNVLIGLLIALSLGSICLCISRRTSFPSKLVRKITFAVNSPNVIGSNNLWASSTLYSKGKIWLSSNGALRKRFEVNTSAFKTNELLYYYFGCPVAYAYLNSRNNYFDLLQTIKFKKCYLWEFDWVLRHHTHLIRCELPCWRPWDSKWRLWYCVKYCFNKYSHKRIGNIPESVTFYCTECKNWQPGDKASNLCNHFGPQYSSDNAGDGPKEGEEEFNRRLKYYYHLIEQNQAGNLPEDFLSSELVPISVELSTEIDKYVCRASGAGDTSVQTTTHADSVAVIENRVKEEAEAKINSEIRQIVAFYSLDKPRAIKMLKALLHSQRYDCASELPQHFFQMLNDELRGVNLNPAPVTTLPATGLIAGSINAAFNKRDWVVARENDCSSSDDSDEYNLPPKEDGRGKFRRVQSHKDTTVKKSNPKHCGSCGCREWTEQTGCCCVCRWYGSRGNKCNCTGCSYADGLADANKETKKSRERMVSVLKEEYDYFKGLPPEEKQDERRNKINSCIRDETRSEYHYKYNLEVGRLGYSYGCCMNGFLGFYDMGVSSFERRVREIKLGKYQPVNISSQVRAQQAPGFSKYVSNKYSYVQNDDEAWGSKITDVPKRAGKQRDHYRKVEECKAWMKSYFKVNAEDQPNRDGFKYLRQASMNKTALWDLYEEEVKCRVDTLGILDYNQFCKVSTCYCFIVRSFLL